MSRQKETPQQKLIKIVHEIGIEKVEEIIAILWLYESGKTTPLFNPEEIIEIDEKRLVHAIDTLKKPKKSPNETGSKMPKCDGDHGVPACVDPECWLADHKRVKQ